MINISTRPLTSKEKNVIRRQNFSDFVGKIEAAFAFMMVIALIILIPFLIFDTHYPISSNIKIAIVIIMLITPIIFIGMANWLNKNFSDLNLKSSLKDIKAEVWHVKTNRAVKKEDSEDSGVGFYVEIIDKKEAHKVLFLWRKYADVSEYEKEFPNTEFNLIKRSDTKQLLNIEILGKYFEPERVVPFFSDKDWKLKYYHNGEIIDMSIDKIK